MTRTGDWFLTYTGRQFWPLDPKPEDVDIRDIAHHLSLVCRFNGAVRRHYSVAQHSVLVSEILPPPLKFYGLMHDAAEAYIGDMVRPLKLNLPQFRAVEDLVWLAVVEKFEIKLPENYVHYIEEGTSVKPITAAEHVKRADNIALMTERRDLLVSTPRAWSTKEQPLPGHLNPLPPLEAEIKFLETFDELEALRP